MRSYSLTLIWRLLVVVIFGWAAVSVFLPVHAAPLQGIPAPSFRHDRIIIKLKEGPQLKSNLASKRGKKGHKVLKNLLRNDGSLQLVAVAAGETVSQAIREYLASGAVEFAEPDYKITSQALPNDPHFTTGLLWRFHNYGQGGGEPGADIQAVKAWDTIHDAPEVIVAILDSGIRYTHEDLFENMWVNPGEVAGNGVDDDGNGLIDDIHGINAVNDSGDPMDDFGHGTHVAGIVGAVGNNNIGLTGVAWKVRLMACKLLDEIGDGSTSDAIQAIDYAREHGAKIMNASWAGSDYSEALLSAISNARNAGIIFVCSAGNSASDNDLSPVYPPNYGLDNMVVVCATSRSDTFENHYSSYGKTTVHLAAPGSAIYSTWHNHDRSYTYLSGTSMAAPIVAGAFALLKAYYPGENDRELIMRMYQSVDPLPSLAEKCVTGGRLNLERALLPIIQADFSFNFPEGQAPLTFKFVDKSSGDVASWKWDFGDGSEISPEQNPSHTYRGSGEFTVQLTVTDSRGLSRSRQRKLFVADNYRLEPTPFQWHEPANPDELTRLDLGDDGVSEAVEIPFTFHFYGEAHTHIFISANGLIGFGSDGLEKTPDETVPSELQPNGFIAPYWQDLNIQESGSVTIYSDGEAPQRKVVITWNSVYSKAAEAVISFQAVLTESEQAIEFNYLEMHQEIGDGSHQPAVFGVEHPSGLLGLTYAAGEGVITNATSIRLVPKPVISLIAEAPESLRFVKKVSDIGFGEPQIITLRNEGNVPVPWRCTPANAAVMVEPAEGILPAGGTVHLKVQPSSEVDPAIPSSALWRLEVINLSGQDIVLETFVQIQILGEPGMEVWTRNEWIIEGKYRGPFEPPSNTYFVVNNGTAGLTWRLDYDTNFFEVSRSTGFLSPGNGIELNVKLLDAANLFHSGVYTQELSFVNTVNGVGNTTVFVPLKIRGNLHFHSTLSLEEQNFSFEVEGEIGREYIIEKSSDLLTWEVLEVVAAPEDGIIKMSTVNDGVNQACFFRVREKEQAP